MKPIFVILMAGAIGGAIARGDVVDGIQAVVHDSVVTIDEVADLTSQTLDVARRQYPNQPELFQKKMDQAKTENIEKLTSRQLILHEFKTAGYSMPESIIDELVQDTIKSEFGDRVTLTKTLQARGLSYEKFRQQVRDRFIERAMRQKNVSQEIIISPHKVETYYLARKEEFKVEDEVKLRMIVRSETGDSSAPSAKKLIEEIQSKLKEGATFPEMESVYSQESKANQGGRWYEGSRLAKGLADAALAVDPGKFSNVMSRSGGEDYWICQYENGRPIAARHYTVDPVTKKEALAREVQITNGELPEMPPPREYFVMFVEDKRAAHFKPLADVRDEIEKSLLLDEQRRLETQWIERLKKKTFVRYF